MFFAIPTPGQLVTVRNRRFVVTGIEASTSQLDLYAELAAQSAQHVVSLQSVDDDEAGEELEVIWGIELGTEVYEKASLLDPTQGNSDTDCYPFLEGSSAGSTEAIPNAMTVSAPAVDREAHTFVMPVVARRQLNDLPDQLWTKIKIEFHKAAADAVFKALVE